MNIHRKDRANKSGLSNSVSSYSKLSKYGEVYNHQAENYSPTTESQWINQQMCFTPSSRGGKSSYAQSYVNMQIPQPYEEEWHGGLRWQVGGRKEKTVLSNGIEEDELDLELRLGHDR